MASPAFTNSLIRLTATAQTALFSVAVYAQAATPAAVSPPAPDFGGNVLQLLLSLGAVLAMIVGALWLLKKITGQRGTTSGLLRVVAGTAVGARERVVIVEVGSTWLVLGVAPGRVSALAEVPRQATAAPGERRPPSADYSANAAGAMPEWLRNLTRRGGNSPS
jgi:flagellar protein FliO/FliZ